MLAALNGPLLGLSTCCRSPTYHKNNSQIDLHDQPQH